MTSRERVLTSLEHKEPDRVPIDFGGFQTGIHKAAYENLIDYLHIIDHVKILDPVQQLAAPCEKVLKRFHVDTRYIGAHGPDSFKNGIVRNEKNGKVWFDLKDEFGVVWSMPEDDGMYMDISFHPLADSSVKDVEKYFFPDGSDKSRFSGVRENASKLRNETDYALCTYIGGVVYEICWYMRGLEQWFIDMLTQPEFCEAVLDRTLAFWMEYYSGFLGEAGDLLDVIMIGDDLAGQGGPLFSPDFYRRIVKPRQKQLVRHIKSLTPAKIWYHTCGDCHEYIEDLIDNGVDILNPVQIGIPGMNLDILKKKFGDRIVFWGGGIDSQHILPFSSPETIREHVRNNINIFKPGGGFVFNSVHNIQKGIPPENITAMYEEAFDSGFYK